MKDYLKNLRKLIGNTPILICGASVIVLNENNEILLQLREDSNCWGYAGGSVDINEVVEDAAKRELLEETGLVATELELFGIFSGEALYHVYPNGDEISAVEIVYLCRDYTGVPQADMVETLKVRFFSIDALPENLFTPNLPALQKLKEALAPSSNK